MKSIRSSAFMLLIIQIWSFETSHSADLIVPNFSEEVTKQQEIYRSKGEAAPAGYTTDRSLALYNQALCAGFDRTVANLGPDDRWLDVGAGKGLAILDYYSANLGSTSNAEPQRRGKASAVAISIEDGRTPLWREKAQTLEPNQIQYLIGKPLREYSLDELGKFQLISDVIGGFSYTDAISQFVEKALALLAVNGSLYTVLQDVHGEDGKNQPYYSGSPFLTEITDLDGAEVKICSWLKSITCVEVTCEIKMDWKPPIEAFRVQKICTNVTVPALALTKYSAGTPPERHFLLKR